MGALETDLDPRKYIGLSFPLRADNNNDFALTKTSLQQSQHNLKNLLLTFPGERVHQPNFGSKLRQLCFEQLDDKLPTRIEEEIRRSVGNWLPYINIIGVQTLTSDSDTSSIYVTVKYSTTLNPQTMSQVTLDASYTATRY